MKIYLDTADIESIENFKNSNIIKGFTTNPSLMRKSNINSYSKFIKKLTSIEKRKPISLEVISDDQEEMYLQAKKISLMGSNLFIKIPITNSKGISSIKIIKKLLEEGVNLNITAVFSKKQIKSLVKLKSKNDYIVSIFCGRIADTSRDPQSFINYAVRNKTVKCKVLWASCREVFNIYQAFKSSADIITVDPEILRKYLAYKNYNLKQFSIETSRMFYNDAKKSKFKI